MAIISMGQIMLVKVAKFTITMWNKNYMASKMEENSEILSS